MNESVRQHLEAALEELRRERDNIDRQIKVVDRALRDLNATPLPAVGDQPDAPSVREIAMDVARRRGSFTLRDVVAAAEEAGNDAQYASISSILARLRNEGVLAAGARRGSYVLAASAAAATGAAGEAGEEAVGEEERTKGLTPVADTPPRSRRRSVTVLDMMTDAVRSAVESDIQRGDDSGSVSDRTSDDPELAAEA